MCIRDRRCRTAPVGRPTTSSRSTSTSRAASPRGARRSLVGSEMCIRDRFRTPGRSTRSASRSRRRTERSRRRQFDDVMCSANELIVPVRLRTRSCTNSRHWPDGEVVEVKLDEMSSPVATKFLVLPPARFDSVAVWPVGEITWITSSPRRGWVMLTSTVTFKVPVIPAGTLITLLTPVALLSGMFLGTSVETRSRVTVAGPPHSGGTSGDVTIVVVELWLGDDAPVPIRRWANAAKILQRLAPLLILTSAWRMPSRACSIVGLHGVSFMPDTTSCSTTAAPTPGAPPTPLRLSHSVAAHSSPMSWTSASTPFLMSPYVNGELDIANWRMPTVAFPVTYAPMTGLSRNVALMKSPQPSPMPPDCRPPRQAVEPPPTRRLDRPWEFSW